MISGYLQHNLPHIHPYAFRHTAASTMIANGVDLVTAARELVHSSPITTATIYAHEIAIARAKTTDARSGVFSSQKCSSKYFLSHLIYGVYSTLTLFQQVKYSIPFIFL